MGCTMNERQQGIEMKKRVNELQTQVEDLKALVNTLLSDLRGTGWGALGCCPKPRGRAEHRILHVKVSP